MCDSRQMLEWDHTAAICATVINMHRDSKKSKPADPVKMNPYRKGASTGGKPQIRLNKTESMKLLKRVFIDHRPPDWAALERGYVK